ncbi:hypothetical protein, partial [Propionibacterium acidifaciens]|uniref:hypothetical protein n=1 Tax=Propionibacterium acidifaciens TaxID=556499 RepID=UPI001B7FA79B
MRRNRVSWIPCAVSYVVGACGSGSPRKETAVLVGWRRRSGSRVLAGMKAEAVLHASRGVDAGIIAETVERTERIVQDGLREGVEGSAVAGVECPPGLQSGCCGVFGVFRAVGGMIEVGLGRVGAGMR